MNEMGAVLAYFITWTTYGTWLPGDKRGWIKKGHAGVKLPNWRIEDESRERMAGQPVILTIAQRTVVTRTIGAHCELRQWKLHAADARTNHVHIVVSAKKSPGEVMNQLKAWCSQKLSDGAGLTETIAVKAGRRRWFTEGGDKELIYDEEHLRNAIRYVSERQ
jgi:REP element-mobilizing transposase RayT